LSPAEVLKFQETLTFACWRQAIALRENLRDSFLSMAPEEAVAGKSLGELELMEGGLRQIEQRFATDDHWMAVVRRHFHFIRRERRKHNRAQ